MNTEFEQMKARAESVVVALSGGIDSSVAALLLKKAGWEVHGLHFRIPSSNSIEEEKIDRCQRLADYLGIPLEISDIREDFKWRIIEPFIESYLKGFTPNPCVSCNELVKFSGLLRYADENDIGCLATGHYVRSQAGHKDSSAELYRGGDLRKEQSYFLHRLDQGSLSRALFPLGELTKDDVKKEADRAGLPVSSDTESQEICFVPDNDYRLFVEDRRQIDFLSPGNIVDGTGRILGTHGGAYRYTIGQRQGLGIASPLPYYVKEIRTVKNEVVVGRKEDIFSGGADADDFNWISGLPSSSVIRAEAQVRYRHRAAPGKLEILSPGRVRFTFDKPQWAVTPGQALVCYDKARVLGGGWIIGTPEG